MDPSLLSVTPIKPRPHHASLGLQSQSMATPPLTLPPARKTSAEILREAKASMVNESARLVTTRRPCTPRDPRRQLYGKGAHPGRPPSAVNLRYLQFEINGPNKANLLQPISFIKPAVEDSLKRVLSAPLLEGPPTLSLPSSRRLPALDRPPKATRGVSVKRSIEQKVSSFLPGNPLLHSKSFDLSHKGFLTSVAHNTRSLDIKYHLPSPKEDAKEFVTGDLLQQEQVDLTESEIQINKQEISRLKTDELIDIIKSFSGLKQQSANDFYISAVLLELYERTRMGVSGNKGHLLGALYGLVESTQPEILLGVARIVLALGVTGSNLTGACKLVYKVARFENNDLLFLNSDVPELLIDGLGRASPLEESEACIYGYGALRFLSQPPSIGQQQTDTATILGDAEQPVGPLAFRLLNNGAAQLMVLHLQMLNEASSSCTLRGAPVHALYQLSGAFRALAGLGSALEAHPEGALKTQWRTVEGAAVHLVRAAELCKGDTDVLGNISRTLSVLSELESCCSTLEASAASLGCLMEPLGAHRGSRGGLVRLAYTIGNVMSHCDMARVQFFGDPKAMSALMEIIQHFSEQDFREGENGETTADVLVKVVRIVANMSVNCEVGEGLGSGSLISALLHILLVTSRNKIQDTEDSVTVELLLATLGALHNLSFYHSAKQYEEPSQRWDDITHVLCAVLSLGPPFASEAARVLGNLTRSQHSREVAVNCGAAKALLQCMDQADDVECLRTGVGVVVNLLGDWERRPLFRELGGPARLLAVLKRAGTPPTDWMLCSLICQAVWNFLIDATNIFAALGEQTTRELAGIVADCLEEDETIPDSVKSEYEEFASVGMDLLDKLEQFLDTVDSSTGLPSDEDDPSYGGCGGYSTSLIDRDTFKPWLEE